MNLQPDNAPFYMVALTSGRLKWYNEKDYTVSPGDLLTLDYEFLDRNSVSPVGSLLNPDGPETDITKETAYVTVSVETDSVTFNTYLFKYDQDQNKMTEEPYLYDTYTIKKQVEIDDEEDKVEPITPNKTYDFKNYHTGKLIINKPSVSITLDKASVIKNGIVFKGDYAEFHGEGFADETITIEPKKGRCDHRLQRYSS